MYIIEGMIEPQVSRDSIFVPRKSDQRFLIELSDPGWRRVTDAPCVASVILIGMCVPVEDLARVKSFFQIEWVAGF